MSQDAKFFVVLCALLIASGCTAGSGTVTGQQHSPVDVSAVTLYLQVPERYEVVGRVEATSEVGLSADAAEQRAFGELRKQAASIGANGVIDIQVGELINWVSARDVKTGADAPQLVKTKIVRGTAIRVASKE